MPADPDALNDGEATRLYFEACRDHESTTSAAWT